MESSLFINHGTYTLSIWLGVDISSASSQLYGLYYGYHCCWSLARFLPARSGTTICTSNNKTRDYVNTLLFAHFILSTVAMTRLHAWVTVVDDSNNYCLFILFIFFNMSIVHDGTEIKAEPIWQHTPWTLGSELACNKLSFWGNKNARHCERILTSPHDFTANLHCAINLISSANYFLRPAAFFRSDACTWLEWLASVN